MIRYLGGIFGAVCLCLANWAAAAAWPEHPVKLIVPYAPGGASDLIARPWADALGRKFGQPFVIDNRGGAGGAIGTEAAARAAPDGYTFLMAPGATLTVLPQLRKVNYDPVKDFLPIARIGDLVCGFVVTASLGINTMPDLVAYAKANPGKLSFGTAGLGSTSHIRLAMLNWLAKTDITLVPYRGSGDALNDLLAGQIQMMNEINPIPHVKTGKLKMLAMNYPTRHPDFPDVPTMTELGYPNADVPTWYSVLAPAGTPAAIVAAFSAVAIEIGRSPDMIGRLREINVAIPIQTPAEIAQFRDADWAVNAALIRDATIKLE